MDFGKVLTAMVTPMNDDGSVNYTETAKLAQYLADNGTDSIVVCGTTGEAPTLFDNERLELFRTVVEAVKGKAKVLAGTGCNCTADTLHLSQEAEKVGVDGLLLVCPYYNKPSQEGLYQHFKTVAEGVSIPIMLYNIPGRTSVNLLPDTVARLAEIKNITCIKEASGNLDQVSDLCRRFGDSFPVYSGDDSLTLPMLAVGAKGVVSVASHLIGNMIQDMIAAYETGKVKEARDLHLQMLPLVKALFITTNPVPVKTALQMAGHQVGPVRLPLAPASPEQEAKLKSVLSEYKLI